jgi:plasmid stabilization system protein ParE
VSSVAVRFRPAALDEAEAATEWYRRRSIRAAEMFSDELDAIYGFKMLRPIPTRSFGTQRIVLRRFPYLVVFRVTTAAVEVIAIAHGYRRPGYWRDRVE